MPGATVIVPSGFNVSPAGTLVGVKVASVGFNGEPSKVSLAKTPVSYTHLDVYKRQ